jgi:hypothetical protein
MNGKNTDNAKETLRSAIASIKEVKPKFYNTPAMKDPSWQK